MLAHKATVAVNEYPRTKVVSITVPGEFAFRGLISRTVATVCNLACHNHAQTRQFSNEMVSATGEAFNNAVIHAYDATSGELRLTVSYDSDEVIVELADWGAAFDLKAVPDYTGDDPQESGMGLFIIRSFVDEMTYVVGPPNRLRMTKRLPTP
jgi:serine/threonine-protein kinase RsbW